MQPIQPTKFTRSQIDQWPVAVAGFNTRVVNCLDRAKIGTIGELRSWNNGRLLALRSFGGGSLRNVRWFFRWTSRLEKGQSGVADLRQWLREFLDDHETYVLEHRYGLNDPLFRPEARRMTLQQIANQLGGLTRERVRQVEEAGLAKLRSRLARAIAAPLERYFVERMKENSGLVSSKDLSGWQGDPVLGGYQPWGALVLLSDALEGIRAYHNCFSCLSAETMQNIEAAVLGVLTEARAPVAFDAIRTQVTALTQGVGVPIDRDHLLRVLLDYHPRINGTVDGRYFLPEHGAGALIIEILRSAAEPLHYYEIAHRYNALVQPSSRWGTGSVLHLLQTMTAAQRIGRGRYGLHTA